MLNKIQKKAYVFGEVVVKSGPEEWTSTGKSEIVEKEISGNRAVIEVTGYNKPINLIREGSNWRIKGLFGVEK